MFTAIFIPLLFQDHNGFGELLMRLNGLFSLDELEGHPHLGGLGLRKSTVRRWLGKGVGGLRLRGYKVGRRWFLCLDDLHEFFQKLADKRFSETQSAIPVKHRTDSTRLRAALHERGLI